MQDLVVGKGGGQFRRLRWKQHGGLRLDEATRQQVQLALRWRKRLAAATQNHQDEKNDLEEKRTWS